MIGTLMAIDDEPIDQKLNKRIVSKSGLVENFIQYLDAKSALEYLENPANRPVDAILLDINMPVMNGFEFLETAYARFGRNFCRVTVVMLTTSVSEADKARASQFNVVQEYLSKPLTLEHLQRVDALLAQAQDG